MQGKVGTHAGAQCTYPTFPCKLNPRGKCADQSVCLCSTRAFMFPRKPNMTPAEALQLLAKLEGTAKAEGYV